MSDNTNNPRSDSSTGRNLGQLMNDAERIAIRTLIEESGTAPTIEESGSIDSVFTVLSHPGRRYILTYLLRAEGYVTMTELVDYVMDRANTAPDDGDFRKQITVKLTHTHLPTLVEEGFVEYNMERQLISETEKTKLVDPYLKVAIVQQNQLAESN